MEPVITLEGRSLEAFIAYLADVAARPEVHSVRVAIDDGGVKLSIDRGSWTRPLGEVKS